MLGIILYRLPFSCVDIVVENVDLSCRIVCCFQEHTGLVNRLLPGMWMLEMVPASYSLVKLLLYQLWMMELKV